MRDLYGKLDKALNKIAFHEIYTGFSKCTFALYDHTSVYFANRVIPYDDRFRGNTSMVYEGEHIAIWNVDNPNEVDIDVQAADLIHEMFHAFQDKNGEKRYPSDLSLLDYPDHLENYMVKHSENQLLVKAFQAEALQEKIALISQFMAARQYREGLIGCDMDQEYYAETIEGMAEYAGCMALKQLSEEKYNERMNRHMQNLQTLNSQFFDIRRMSYSVGTLFCIVLQQAEMDFYHALGSTQAPLFRLVTKNAMAIKPLIDFNETALLLELRRYVAEKKQQFDDFLAAPHEKVEIEAKICGYDPMNMIKMDNRILCSHFVVLQNNTMTTALFLQGPVMLHMKQGSAYEVVSYMTSGEKER